MTVIYSFNSLAMMERILYPADAILHAGNIGLFLPIVVTGQHEGLRPIPIQQMRAILVGKVCSHVTGQLFMVIDGGSTEKGIVRMVDIVWRGRSVLISRLHLMALMLTGLSVVKGVGMLQVQSINFVMMLQDCNGRCRPMIMMQSRL
jgi:hypothetical protein